MIPRRKYQLELPGLDDQVSGASVDVSHASLLKCIRLVDGLEACELVTSRGDRYLVQRSVVGPGGQVISDDHRAWLAEQLEGDGGDVAGTLRRLRPQRLRLSKSDFTTLYVVMDRGGAQDHVIQVEIDVLDERIDRDMFNGYPSDDWRVKTLDDLIAAAESGWPVDEQERSAVRPPRYQLRSVVDVAAFIYEASRVQASAEDARGRRLFVVSRNGRPDEIVSAAELAGEGPSFIWRGQRIVEDWAASSAGLSGHRLCKAWAMDMTDYTSPAGVRTMDLIPLWTHKRPMAQLKRLPSSPALLMEKLASIDRRVGVPFAWYFYMLHGNLFGPEVGRVVIGAAERGVFDLPEHDYQVLRRWRAAPYSF